MLQAMQLASRRSLDLGRMMAEGTSDEAVLRLCTEWGLDAGQAHAVLIFRSSASDWTVRPGLRTRSRP